MEKAIDMRAIVDGSVPYYLLWNAHWGCGNPLVAFTNRYGITMYEYWKERYEVQGIPFKYSEAEFGYERIKRKDGRELFLYTFPKPEKEGQCIAVAVLFDNKNYRYARVDLSFVNGKYEIIGKNEKSRVMFFFGEVEPDKMKKRVSGLFDIILDLVGDCMHRAP